MRQSGQSQGANPPQQANHQIDHVPQCRRMIGHLDPPANVRAGYGRVLDPTSLGSREAQSQKSKPESELETDAADREVDKRQTQTQAQVQAQTQEAPSTNPGPGSSVDNPPSSGPMIQGRVRVAQLSPLIAALAALVPVA
ncbi:hypothetical protein ANO14919_113920 [Xylariales sp. No.14919]|nr:hypothetical protein ANO14919_113920 [Xylariales sp. No.14919]